MGNKIIMDMSGTSDCGKW